MTGPAADPSAGGSRRYRKGLSNTWAGRPWSGRATSDGVCLGRCGTATWRFRLIRAEPAEPVVMINGHSCPAAAAVEIEQVAAGCPNGPHTSKPAVGSKPRYGR